MGITSTAGLLERKRLGEGVFYRLIEPTLKPEDDGKFVAIEVRSGDFEMNEDDTTAVTQVLSRHPDGEVWIMRVGHIAAYRL